LPSKHRFMRKDKATLRAELRRTRLTAEVVGAVRLEMLGPGFALVDTPPFFNDDLFLRLKGTTVLSCHSKRWEKLPQLARYACWLEDLLRQALPEEFVSLASLEFRHEAAQSVDRVTDRLHADGSYLRAVYTLTGLPTLYHDETAERPVPQGQTLLMTAHDRTRRLRILPTLHRRPGAGPERAVLVCSLEPRHEDAQRVDPYRQAAQMDRAPRVRTARSSRCSAPHGRSATRVHLSGRDR
jgi:hypothetical protein